ncbi:MAG: MATE family efflux transporter [Thermomicrobiales bacterium]
MSTVLDERDIALEIAEAAPAPGVIAEFTPEPENVPAEPMTQRRVLGLATPIIGENLLQTAVGAVDTFMVARLGAAAVAGVGTGFEIVFFIISILSAIDIGATVLVSQAIGAGDSHRANQLARQAIVWGLLLAIPVSIIIFFASPTIVGFFGTEPDVAAAATIYMEIISATAVALFLSFVCGAILRGAGDSRTPLYAAIVANIINIGVAYLLIFGNFGFPALGVAGSAWGAALGRGVGAIVMLAAMVWGNRKISLRGSWGWKPEFRYGKELFTLGIPAATEQMLTSGSFMVLVGVVAMIGTPALAAQQIAFTSFSVAFLPGLAFSIAATALVGQSIGARLPADARKAWLISMRWAFIWMGIGSVLVYLYAEQMMRIYTDDADVIRDGVLALHSLAIALPIWSIWIVSSGCLRGTGDTRTPLIVGTSAMWSAVGLAWLGVNFNNGGMDWVWICFALTAIPAAIIMTWMVRKRLADYESGRREMPSIAESASAMPAH